MEPRAFAACCVLLGALFGGPAGAAITDYPFRVLTRMSDAGFLVMAENDGPAPITVHLEASPGAGPSDAPRALTAVVPAHTSLQLGRSVAAMRFEYSYHFGRLGAVQDERTAYRLPFEDGLAFRVSQAYGGRLTTHADAATQYAVDFAMPAGSAVVAARGGIVVDVTLRYSKGAIDAHLIDRANSVTIVHDDGSVAEYAHLSPGPALVAAGERVNAGDLLGYSGSTGYSSAPHLHFIVTRPEVREGRVIRISLPVQFYADDAAERFSAQMGTTLRADYGPGRRYAASRTRQASSP